MTTTAFPTTAPTVSTASDLDRLSLGTRARNALRRAGIHTISQAVLIDPAALVSHYGLSAGTTDALALALADYQPTMADLDRWQDALGASRTPIADLPLPARALDRLHRQGLRTIADLARTHSDSDLAAIAGVGPAAQAVLLADLTARAEVHNAAERLLAIVFTQ